MKKYVRSMVIFVFLVSISLACSGCWTAVGAIIGHQSGELLAGALIGAGIDVGIGLAEEADRQSEDLVIESEKGKIYAKITCNGAELIKSIEEAFDGEGWQYTLEVKKVRKNQDSEARWKIGNESEISIKVQKNKLKLNIKADNKDTRMEFTDKLAELLKDKFKSAN